MRFPDLKHFGLNDSVVPEPGTGIGRIVLWVAGSNGGGVQSWERIGDASGPEIEERGGFCAAEAMSIPLDQETPTFWEKLRRRVRPAAVADGWVTPAGEPAKQRGPKRKDLLLVWSEDANAAYDEQQLAQHWPESKEYRRLGSNLFLLSGVGEHPSFSQAHRARQQLERLHAREEHFEELSRPENDPRRKAEEMLASARSSGDLRKQAVALIDLGSTLVRRGEAETGMGHLEQGLVLARQSGDSSTEYDALTNLGIGYTETGKTSQALETLQHVLTQARSVGDRFLEKMVLAELGAVHISLRQPDRALEHYGSALRIAGELGDQGSEANLAWAVAICCDELGQREQAIHFAQSGVELLQRLGTPQSQAYADCLDRFRRGDAPLKANRDGTLGEPVATSPDLPTSAILAGAADHSTKPPSILRMAHSAAKAMAKFVSSGFKTVSREAHERRLATCGECQYHTGVRCRLCGCFTGQKAWLPHEHCPAGKWPV